jgi:hypothetical protein
VVEEGSTEEEFVEDEAEVVEFVGQCVLGGLFAVYLSIDQLVVSFLEQQEVVAKLTQNYFAYAF